MQNKAKYSCNIITQNMLTKTDTQLKMPKHPATAHKKSRNILTKNTSAVITIHLLNFYASCEKLRGRLSYPLPISCSSKRAVGLHFANPIQSAAYLCPSLRISDNLLHVCFGLDFIHLSLDIRQDCSL